MNSFKEFLNFIPPCFRPEGAKGAVVATSIKACLLDPTNGALFYWIQRLLVITAVASMLYVLYGGFMMVTAYGNEARFTAAKRTVSFALIGLIVSLLAQLLVYAFINLLGSDLTPPPRP